MLHLANKIGKWFIAVSNAAILTIPKGDNGFGSFAWKGMGRADGTWLALLATTPE
jgi:hypothetical protein